MNDLLRYIAIFTTSVALGGMWQRLIEFCSINLCPLGL